MSHYADWMAKQITQFDWCRECEKKFERKSLCHPYTDAWVVSDIILGGRAPVHISCMQKNPKRYGKILKDILE